MIKIAPNRSKNIFGALKLIEQLYIEGEIPAHVFRNILQEYSDEISMTDFSCYKTDAQKKE